MLIGTVQQATVKALTMGGVDNVWCNPPRDTTLPFVKMSLQAVPTRYKLDSIGEEIDIEFTILTQSEYNDFSENYEVMEKITHGMNGLELSGRVILSRITEMSVISNEQGVEVGTLRYTLRIY